MKRMLSALSLGLALTLTPAAQAQDAQGNRAQILERIETERQAALTALQQAIAAEHDLRADAPGGIYRLLGDSDPNMITYRMRLDAQSKKVAEAEARYRQALSAEILTATRGLDQRQTTDYLFHRDLSAGETYRNISDRARARLADRVHAAGNDQQRRAAFAEADSRLRAAQLEEEIVAAAQRRHQGQDDSVRLRQLLDRAASTKVTLRPSDIADPRLREYETYLRKTRMEQQIAEYRRLARSGRLIDPASNQVISGQRRLELAMDAETALAQELDARTLKPNRYDILSWTLSEPERRTQSKILAQEIKETDDYTALNHMGSAAAGDISEQLRAMGQAVRLQQTGVNDWRAKFTKNHAPTGIGAIDETINVIRTGSADFARQAGGAGHMSIDQVDQRIGRYHEQADALVAALNTAASANQTARRAGQEFDPKSLPPDTYKLLKDGHFIAPTARGTEVLQIPHDGPSLSRLKSGLDLPGDHLLNMVSAEKMMEMAAMSYIPGAAAGRVGKLMEGLQLGTTATRAGTIAADVITGMALDAGVEYARTGKVDAGRLAIESTFLQGATTGLGRGTGALTKRMASVFKNPTTRKAMEVALAQGLGLSSEAALQTYFQSAMEGKDMSYEDFLANMVSGVMGRGTSGAIHKEMFKVMPEDLARDMSARQEVLFRNKRKANDRLKKVLGDSVVDSGLTRESLRLNRLASTERVVKRMDEALTSGEISWAELKMLYADHPGLFPMMKGLAEHRARTFQSYVEPAQALARKELSSEYWLKRQEILAKHPSKSVFRDRALERLNAEYQADLRDINKAPRAPGSDNVTSDIDRSNLSPRVRKHLKELYRIGDGENPKVTSARSYDVNEYIDVFPTINKTMPHSRDLAGLPVETGDFKGLNHEQAIEAGSMATAMLHMNDAQRAKYRENTLADAADAGLAGRQLDMAQASLARADRELQAEMDRLVADDPRLARNRSDLAVRARDNLYGKRTEALQQQANELMHVENQIKALQDKGVAEDAPQMQELRAQERQKLAQMQRDWGLSLREGIETYASFSGLDAIVNDGQLRKRSIRDLINDPGYRIAGEGETPGKDNSLKGFTPKQLDGFMRDQVMMMTHHMNGFREGHEGAVDAGSAMGKYAERAVLALKLQGQDLSKPPFKELNEIAEQMVKARKDPAKLRAYMEQIGQKYAGKKDADAGLEVLSGLIEQAIPQTRGLWDAGQMGLAPKRGLDPTAKPDARELRRQIASRRHLLRDEEEERLNTGPASAAAMNAARMASLQQELAGLEAGQAERARLGREFRPEDWDQARALQAENAQLEHRLKWMEGLGTKIPADHPAKQKLAANNAKLNALREAYRAAGGTGQYQPGPEEDRDQARMRAIREELEQRGEAAKGYEAQQAQVVADRAKADLPEGVLAEAPELLTEGFDPAQGGVLRVSLDGQALSVPIVPR